MYCPFEMIYDCLFERSDSALNHFEMIYLLSLWNDFSKETVFCTPLACSECLPIESWPNSIGKHPAEKSLLILSRWSMTFISKWAAANTIVLKWYIYCRFEMSNTVLCPFRYDIWLSFRNDRAKFSYRELFSLGKTPCILVTKMPPKPHIFVHRFFRSDCPLAAWK